MQMSHTCATPTRAIAVRFVLCVLVTFSLASCVNGAASTITSTAGLPPLSTGPPVATDYASHLSLLDGRFDLYWTLVNLSSTRAQCKTFLHVAATANTTGWVGIGFGTSMRANSTIYVGRVLDDLLLVQEFLGVSYRPPTFIEDVDDPDIFPPTLVDGVSGVESGKTFFSAYRCADVLLLGVDATGSVNDTNLVDMFVGYNPSTAEFSAHGFDNRINFQVNLVEGDASDDSSSLRISVRFQIHGALMTVAWLVLVPLGAATARYLKWWRGWFHLHIVVQSTALIFTVVGFAMAASSVSAHFQTLHTVIGGGVCVAGILQAILGTLADRMYNPDRSHVPIFPDILHWYIGRLSVLAAIVTVILGMNIFGVGRAYWIFCGTCIGVAVAFFLFKEMWDTSHERIGPHNTNVQGANEDDPLLGGSDAASDHPNMSNHIRDVHRIDSRKNSRKKKSGSA